VEKSGASVARVIAGGNFGSSLRLKLELPDQPPSKITAFGRLAGRRYAILAFCESSDYVSGVQTQKRRPVQREPIVLNLDRCRKFVELLERRVDNKSDSLPSVLRKEIPLYRSWRPDRYPGRSFW
jgi:hypothetical protein